MQKIAGGRLRDRDRGFSLVEVVVAMSIFAVMVPSTIAVVAKTTSGVADNRSRVVAAGLASSQLERVRSQSAGAIAAPNSPQTIGNRTYTITQVVSPASIDGSAVTCSSVEANIGFSLVSVRVSWPDMGSTQPVRADTLVRSTTSGALAVTVTGASGQAVSGIPVTLSNGTVIMTDGTGCALFGSLAPGSYTASLNSAGFAGNGNSQLVTSSPVTVVAGLVGKLSMTYDAAMTLAVRYVEPNGSAALSQAELDEVPTALRTGTVTSSYASTSAAIPGTASGLFPASYSARSGSGSVCTLATKDLSSGTPAAQTVDVPAAKVVVDNFNTIVAIGTIKAIYQGPSIGSGAITCPVGTTFDVGAVMGLSGDHSATLPLGTWKIQVPWSVFGSIPIPGLTVYCYPVTLTSGTSVSQGFLIDFLTWVTNILFQPLNWLTGGC